MGTKIKIEIGKKYKVASGQTVAYLDRDKTYKLNYFKIEETGETFTQSDGGVKSTCFFILKDIKK